MSDQSLKISIARLARRSPSDWDQFLAEYRAYQQIITTQLVTSPPDSLQVAQGRARQCNEFLRILEDSLKTADLTERK
jgi:hypothetical protein